MKILFTTTVIKRKNNDYLVAAKKLINQILEKTKHDILISTNEIDFFSDIKNNRLTVRNNIKETSKFSIGTEFNFNLKYHSFEGISDKYDYIIYLDCDIKLEKWSNDTDIMIEKVMNGYDFGADRITATLGQQINEFKKDGKCLFQHKIRQYNILEEYGDDHDIMNSTLPSEHFLIIKNDTKKIEKFYKKWEELNNHLQNIILSNFVLK